MQFILYAFYPLLAILIILLLFSKTESKIIIFKHRHFLVISMFAIFIMGNVFIYYFLKNERFIYYWDYAAFWKRSIQLNQWIKTNPNYAISEIFRSMNYDEYTYFPVLLISLPTQILGKSFLSYVLSIFNFFVLPLIALNEIIFLLLMRKLKIEITTSILFLVFSLTTFFVGWYYTLLSGYIGVIGQLFIVLLFLIVLTDDIGDWRFKDYLVINSSMFFLIFIRRWYIIWVISFYVVYFLFYITPKLLKKEFKIFMSHSLKILASGIGLFLTVVFFFRPYLQNLLFNNYGYQYQAYNDSNNLEFFLKLLNFYGILIMISISVTSFYILNKKIDNEVKRFIAFLILLSISNTMIFLTIQGFDWHHFNLLNTQILILSFVGLITISKQKPSHFIFLSFYFILNFLIVFSNLSFGERIPLNLFSNVRRIPIKRDSITQIQDLALYLHQLTINNRYAYVAANSSIISDDILRNSQLPWVVNSVPNLDLTSTVDLNNGFPKDFFSIDYVVSTCPTQYSNLLVKDQYMITLINEAILYEEKIRDNYTLIHTLRIDDVDIYVFERVTDYTLDEINYFKEKLIKRYPNDPNLFSVNY